MEGMEMRASRMEMRDLAEQSQRVISWVLLMENSIHERKPRQISMEAEKLTLFCQVSGAVPT